MKLKQKLLLVPSLALFSAGLNAATVTFSDVVSMPNDTDVSIFITQFDTTTDIDSAEGAANSTVGATLTKVTVTVKSIISGANVQMDNDSESAQSGTARVQNLVNSYSGPNTLNASFGQSIESGDMQLNQSQIFNLGATSGDSVGTFDVTGESDYAAWSPGVLEAGDSGVVDSAVYSSVYEGTGDLEFAINSTYTTSASFSGENGFFQGNTPTGQFFVEVIYEYDAASPVPEPSAYAALLGLVTLGYVCVRRRK